MVITIEMVNRIKDWIKDYFKKNSFFNGVVLGMSGGKDSMIVAKLFADAIGKEKVFGIIMPNGEMKDKSDAERICKLLGIKYTIINIQSAYNEILQQTKIALNQYNIAEITNSISNNIPPRLRMTTLYSIASGLNYLVANTSNLSEASVGYTTKWGDNVGDISPIANFTKTEVCEIGLLLGLPKELVLKAPSDGLCGKTDEDNMKLKYANLDNYIRTGKPNEDIEQILKMHKSSEHKRTGVISFEPNLNNIFIK